MFKKIRALFLLEGPNSFEPVVILPVWKSLIVDWLTLFSFGLCRWRWGGITLEEWYKGFSGPVQITCDAAVKSDPEAMEMIQEIAELTGATIIENPCPRMDLWRGGGCRVPESIGKCPECGGQLEVLCMSWDEVTGQPIAPDLEIVCLDEPLNDGDSGINHSWNQSRWQPVKDAISMWAEASQSSYNRIVGLGSSAE